MEDGQTIAIGAQPRDAKDVETWLRCYPSWVEDLQSAGYYGVQPDLGTRVQSNREGRPTERAAILLASLLERVRTVEQWLEGLSVLEHKMSDHYTKRVSIRTLAEFVPHTENSNPYEDAKAIVRALPHTIWSRWYET